MSSQDTNPLTPKGPTMRKAVTTSAESTPVKGGTNEANKYIDVIVYLLAINPELKLNYRAMAVIDGVRTVHSFEHQFRPLRAKAKDLIETLGEEKWKAILANKGTTAREVFFSSRVLAAYYVDQNNRSNITSFLTG